MNRELIMQTLFARLTAPPIVFNFTADVTADDVTLTSISDTSGLLLGMPISGRGIAQGTTLATIEPNVTLSKAPTLTAPGVDLVQGIADPGRILKPVGEIANFPALCLVEGQESYPSISTGDPKTPSNMPQIVTLHPYAWIYAIAKDPAAVPNAIMNVLLDAIDKAILPAPGSYYQNLGLKGIHHCRIEGQQTRAPGIDGQVSARVQFVIQALLPVATEPL